MDPIALGDFLLKFIIWFLIIVLGLGGAVIFAIIFVGVDRDITKILRKLTKD